MRQFPLSPEFIYQLFALILAIIIVHGAYVGVVRPNADAFLAEEALRLATSIGRSDTVLCGERGGEKIEGFDLGNSPLEFRAERVEGKTLVCTTTNGTDALRHAEGAAELCLCCYRNLQAVAERLHATP